ncbi:hypothetical protein LCGC14_1922420 [marine sediment metagenome]|uniref:Uncharacterized protein n=1 Tax=marine sediment metagenome TaxID=412755 RepID=A0A0F9GDS0_9ZZZZ
MVDEAPAAPGADETTPADPIKEGPDSPPDLTPEVGTDLGGSVPSDPPVPPGLPPEADPEANPEAADDDDEEDEAEEMSAVEAQANFVPPPPLDQAGHIQGLMVAGNNQGEVQRRKTIARNRERRRLQQEAIAQSNQG